MKGLRRLLVAHVKNAVLIYLDVRVAILIMMMGISLFSVIIAVLDIFSIMAYARNAVALYPIA